MAKYLEQAGIDAAAIHGDKSQGQRERALAAFKAGKVRALVATDIAARGIDVDAVSHVVQFELPQRAGSLRPPHRPHRARRRRRARPSAFCADDERNLLHDIQKLTRQTIPSFDRRNDKLLGAVTAATTSGPSAEQALPQAKARSQNGQHRSPKPHGHRPNGHQGQSGGGNGGNRNRRRGGGGAKGPSNGAAKPAWNPLQA